MSRFSTASSLLMYPALGLLSWLASARATEVLPVSRIYDFDQGYCREYVREPSDLEQIFRYSAVFAANVNSVKLETITTGEYHYALYVAQLKVIDVLKYPQSPAVADVTK